MLFRQRNLSGDSFQKFQTPIRSNQALRGGAYEKRIRTLISDAPIGNFGAKLLVALASEAAQMPPEIMNQNIEEAWKELPGPLKGSLDSLFCSMGIQKYSELLSS